MHPRRLPSLVLPVLLLALPCRGSVLGLRPALPVPDHSYHDLSREELDAFIAQTERDLYEKRLPPGPLHLRMVQLLGATLRSEDVVPLVWHAERAMEDPSVRRDALLALTARLTRGQELDDGVRLMEKFTREVGDEPEILRAWGCTSFVYGLRYLDPDRFRVSRRCFLRAAKLQRDDVDLLLGLASSALVIEDTDAVVAASRRLLELRPGFVPALLLLGCGLDLAGHHDEAQDRFEEAFATLPVGIAESFRDGAGLLVDTQENRRLDPEGYWRAVNPHPSWRSNLRRLEFYRRMVEADLLYGQPEEDLPGWKTKPGEAWVRWGRPEYTYYLAGDITEDNAARTRPQSWRRHITGALEPDEQPLKQVLSTASDVDEGLNRWIWHYDYGERSFDLVFIDVLWDFSWGLTSVHEAVFASKIKEAPLFFASTAPPPDFGLGVAAAGFYLDETRTVLETDLSIDPWQKPQEDAPPRYRVEWAVFDREGRRLDYRSMELGEERLRSQLMEHLGEPPPADGRDPLLARVPVQLPPGSYRVGVEATCAATDGHQAYEYEVSLRARPRGALAMSDLQLVASYQPFAPGGDLPADFVKHAQIVLPTASSRFVEGAGDIYVYYEIYDLGTDERGSTWFDVGYSLLPLDEESEPFGNPSRTQPVVALQRSYLDERTGLSPRGSVVKGTKVELALLPPGRYRLIVEATDHHRQEATVTRKVDLEIVAAPTAPR